jgi:hypothetical protein
MPLSPTLCPISLYSLPTPEKDDVGLTLTFLPRYSSVANSVSNSFMLSKSSSSSSSALAYYAIALYSIMFPSYYWTKTAIFLN